MQVLIILLWLGVCVAVFISTMILFGGMASAKGAPQEAVVCALAVAVAVIPYVFARSIEGVATALLREKAEKQSLEKAARREAAQQAAQQADAETPEYNYLYIPRS